MDAENNISQLVSKFINTTNRSIFLTGRAGTGKTTLLHEIIRSTHKNTIVAAPTGIAAINAGGVTLHSLFQLPFGTFIPDNIILNDDGFNTSLTTPKSLLSKFQMNKTKRNMIREMELLIIDEVSMLRADLLDAIDTILKYIKRRRDLPFGGVQVLFIGDLLQLPPVVKDDEWNYLNKYYKGMYFFNALVLQNNQPLYIELEKIYRQTDQTFIGLLNNLRDNKISESDIATLNKFYKPDFKNSNNDGYILLTTHNRIADSKNKEALNNIKAKSHFFNATTDGDFSEYLYPVDPKLELKVGAQVMFIKNDYSGEQRYFNGKIGKVSSIDDDELFVSFDDGTDPVEVEPYLWENKKYTLNKETNEIQEKVVGQFKHLPLKLAWAITVHKSQGLTFDKAIIDVGNAFAPGQIYVALSRLTSLEGLVLSSPIPANGIKPDPSLSDFSQNKKYSQELENILTNETKAYLNNFILGAFDLSRMIQELGYHVSSYTKDAKRSIKQQYKEWASQLLDDSRPVKKVADNFRSQIYSIIQSEDTYQEKLHERIVAAIGYFEPILQKLSDRVYDKISDLHGQKGIKAYVNELRDLDQLYNRQLQLFYKAESLIDAALKNKDVSREVIKEPAKNENRKVIAKETKTKKATKKKAGKKEDTKAISFELYKQGKSIKQIAIERTLVPGTIEGHLAHYIREGKLKVTEFIDADKFKKIAALSEELDTLNLGQLKSELSTDVSYGELRMAVAGILADREN